MKKPEFLDEAGKKLKKIWDILRDKRVVSFRLTVKLYRDGVSEPNTISMQGERAADGDWKTMFPRDQNPGPYQSPAALKEKLASIEKSVLGYIMESKLDADWKKQEASIKEMLKSGISVEDLAYQSKTPIRAIAAYGYDAHFCAPIIATAYAIEGAEALAKNNLDHASHCVDRGLYWSDSDMFITNPNDRFTERASAGGKGKALGYAPVKDKVAELLIKLAPSEGWKSTTAAIDAVDKELDRNHTRFVEKYRLKTENLPRVILGWVQADPERFPHRIKSKA